jgi:hypothetical protein
MRFNPHSDLAGLHAQLSASKYHWINYDDDKMDRTYTQAMMARRGTELHQLAHDCIRLGVKLPSTRKTINLYVNDAIGFKMSPEVVLYYSMNCFGTADAIGFRNRKLRIHDLKTGVNAGSVHQLEVYAALFCLEYNFKPTEIEIELRIYQSNDVQIYIADPDVITHIISKIIGFDRLITNRRLEEMQ